MDPARQERHEPTDPRGRHADSRKGLFPVDSQGPWHGYTKQRTDRRRQPTPRLSRYSFFGGRRKGPRRLDERDGAFVDIYGARLWMLVFWTAGLNLADCFFTLVHLQAGGLEVNPMADLLLQTGRVGFVVIKAGLIGLALVVLTVHKNFWLARVGLGVAAGVYTLLTAYHLSLFLV